MCYQMHVFDYDEKMVPIKVAEEELTPYQQDRVKNNINLVYACIHREIHGTWKFTAWEDLSQTGFVALCRAAHTYHAGKGVKFSTYAYTCILNALLTECLQRIDYQNHVTAVGDRVFLIPESPVVYVPGDVQQRTCENEKYDKLRRLLSTIKERTQSEKVKNGIEYIWQITEGKIPNRIAVEQGLHPETVARAIRAAKEFLAKQPEILEMLNKKS